MIVTQRDLVIADYSIASYGKIDPSRLAFRLLIYANCLTGEQKDFYFPRWRKFPFAEIFDNEEKVRKLKLIKGEMIYSPEGIPRVREGSNENCDELWTTELKNLSTEYHATVDADFEILDPQFVYEMMQTLDRNRDVIAVSTDYTPTQYHVYDSYSEAYIDLCERWHTWFCIYKRAALQCPTSHFYYETHDSRGNRFAFDSAALFQKNLRERFGWEIRQIDSRFQGQFIHYGAFSKNCSLGEWNIFLYRRLAIARKIGIRPPDARSLLVRKINSGVKILAGMLYQRVFQKYDQERLKYQ